MAGWNNLGNIEVVEIICDLLDEMSPAASGMPRRELITFVTDRLGHDRRYAIDPGKILSELDWRPRSTFASGIRSTVQWYLDNPQWVSAIRSGAYQKA